MFCNIIRLTARNLQGISRLATIEPSFLAISSRNVFTRQDKKSTVFVDEPEDEHEIFDLEITSTPQEDVEEPVKKPRKRRSKNHTYGASHTNKQVDIDGKDDTGKTPTDWGGLPMFTKLYENEEAVSGIMLGLMSKKRRKKKELMILEGSRLIQEALETGLVLDTLVFSRVDDVKKLPIKKAHHPKLFKIPYRTVQLWSSLTTSPGIIGVFQRPKPRTNPSEDSLPITIICDNIRDPGNMGSILRAAAGIGCEKVLLTKGCVDVWDMKVLRAAAGAHFRLPMYPAQTWNEITNMVPESAKIYVADNNAKREYIESEIELNDKDEAAILDAITDASETNENEDETEGEHETKNEPEGKATKKPERFKKPVDMSNLPVVPYYSVDYTKSEIVIVVGGETHGLSHDCFQLTEQRGGIRVNVPLNNDIESLNTGMAVGIIGFEAKRQFLQVSENINKQESGSSS